MSHILHATHPDGGSVLNRLAIAQYLREWRSAPQIAAEQGECSVYYGSIFSLLPKMNENELQKEVPQCILLFACKFLDQALDHCPKFPCKDAKSVC